MYFLFCNICTMKSPRSKQVLLDLLTFYSMLLKNQCIQPIDFWKENGHNVGIQKQIVNIKIKKREFRKVNILNMSASWA